MFFSLYGHGGHLEFQIMTYFSLIFYIYHINTKYEISLKLAKYFHRKFHLKFFMNGCNFHKNFIYVIRLISVEDVRNYLSHIIYILILTSF